MSKQRFIKIEDHNFEIDREKKVIEALWPVRQLNRLVFICIRGHIRNLKALYSVCGYGRKNRPCPPNYTYIQRHTELPHDDLDVIEVIKYNDSVIALVNWDDGCYRSVVVESKWKGEDPKLYTRDRIALCLGRPVKRIETARRHIQASIDMSQ